MPYNELKPTSRGTGESMAVTIRDVAKLAGVSYQTVSRVINNAPNVKDETRERVMKTIRMLDYYPNNSAQNLQKKIVNAIGFTYPNSAQALKDSSFYSIVLSEACSICDSRDIFLNLLPYHSTRSDVERLIRNFNQKVISGILMTAPTSDIDVLAELTVKNVPVVILGRPPAPLSISYVDNDNREICRQAIEYLFTLGHRHIGLINGPREMTMCDDVQQGYAQAYQEKGLPLPGEYIMRTALDNRDPYEVTRSFLARHPEVTALVGIDHMVTLSAMEAAQAAGRRIPDQLSLLTLDYSDWNRYLNPPLTGFYKNAEQLGSRAVQMLLQQIYEEAEPTHELIGHEFREGGSCCPLP